MNIEEKVNNFTNEEEGRWSFHNVHNKVDS